VIEHKLCMKDHVSYTVSGEPLVFYVVSHEDH